MNSFFKNLKKSVSTKTAITVVFTTILVYVLYKECDTLMPFLSTSTSGRSGADKEHFQNSHSDNGEGKGKGKGKAQAISDPGFNPKDEKILVTFYAFDYCGYCKQFQPTWEKAKKQPYTGNIEFRYYEANKLSKSEKERIPYYVDPSYAPNVILTVNGKNIEFKRQPSVPMEGLDVFIRSRGTKYFK